MTEPAEASKPKRWRLRLITRASAKRIMVYLGILVLAAVISWFVMIRMPGSSYTGPLPPLTPRQSALAASLRRDVEELAGRIGQRNFGSRDRLVEAAEVIERRFRDLGLTPVREPYLIGKEEYWNIAAELKGSEEIVLVGAHYDSVLGANGANDNASGVAGLLAVAEEFARASPRRTLRFVAFVNEEPPHFQTESMGSLVCARACKARGEKIVAMVSLETIGCYLDGEGTQAYPPPLSLFYPSTGNFIAFVGNTSSRSLVRRAIGTFRAEAQFPSEGAALPGAMAGVGWSDHWAFWQVGYPAIMVTDTAPFRYFDYHTAEDTPDKVDADRCARVMDGVMAVVRDLVDGP